MKPEDMTLFSGASRGAESEFGRLAEHYGLQEVNYTFEGHANERTRGLHELSREELVKGDVSLHYVSRLLNRNYNQKGETFRKILQALFHVINGSREVFVIGEIQADRTVKGGTGWGAEFAKLCNKRLHSFDQVQGGWFLWDKEQWKPERQPKLRETHFAGLGTRFLQDSGREAIAQLYKASLS